MIPIALLVILALILILTGIILAYSPGKPKPLADLTGKIPVRSLSEKIFLTIGGVKQGMFIMSRDTNNPVLLYLHGGMPDYFLSKKYPTALEDMFTMVWWEQRGSGISYSHGTRKDTITVNILLTDVRDVTDYLCKRFGKEKIYLMGHSGGTFIGIQAVAQHPEKYHAYIGVAQMTDQFKSEKLARDYMLRQYRDKGDKRMTHRLESATITETISPAYLKIRDKAMHELGIGTMHNMNSVFTGLFVPSLLCRDYTFKEKLAMWAGKASSGVSLIWKDIISADLKQTVTRIDIPVYFCCGIFDYTVNYSLAKEYFNSLEAPVKGFYTFENSAHSPLFEEPSRMQRIMKEDVLNGSINLADTSLNAYTFN